MRSAKQARRFVWYRLFSGCQRLAGQFLEVLLMRGDPDIVKFLVGEERRDAIGGVTRTATAFALKQGTAALGLFADGLLIPQP